MKTEIWTFKSRRGQKRTFQKEKNLPEGKGHFLRNGKRSLRSKEENVCHIICIVDMAGTINSHTGENHRAQLLHQFKQLQNCLQELSQVEFFFCSKIPEPYSRDAWGADWEMRREEMTRYRKRNLYRRRNHVAGSAGVTTGEGSTKAATPRRKSFEANQTLRVEPCLLFLPQSSAEERPVTP